MQTFLYNHPGVISFFNTAPRGITFLNGHLRFRRGHILLFRRPTWKATSPQTPPKQGFPGPEFIKSPSAAKNAASFLQSFLFFGKGGKKLAGTAFPPSPPMDPFAICSYPGWRRSCSPRSSRIYTFSFHGAPRRKIPRPQPEAPEYFAGSYSHTHPKIRPMQRTRNATTQAMAHWLTTVTAAARALPISRLTVAMAATQGV